MTSVRWRPGMTSPSSESHPSRCHEQGLDDVGVPAWPGDGRPAVLSLDVFDTVLARACGAPQDLYLWLGRLLAGRALIPCSPEVFARLRHRVELDVWNREGGLDANVGLVDLYVEVCRRLLLDESIVPTFVDLEMSLESRVLRVVPGATSLVKRAADEDVEVVFTSDTYHSADYLRARLMDAGLLSDAGRCLVSSQYGESKASGRLFRRLTDSTVDHPIDVLHVGDNPHSDVDVPRQLGLRATWLPVGRLNRYERLLSDRAFESAGLAASFAGASRMTRLSHPAYTGHQRAIRDVAAGVAAPLLTGYVLWLLERARRLGLSRLVFLARDGQVLARIARRLVERLDLPLQVHYLLVSRRSTNLAATFDLTEEETAWILRDRAHLSPAALLDRLGLRADEIGQLLDGSGASIPVGSGDQVAELLALLRGEGPLRHVVLERASERRLLLRAYLDQEGLLDGQPIGIVDFGGVGSQVRALHAVMADAGVQPPRIFLIGLDDPRQAGLPLPAGRPLWLDDTEAYMYDHRRGRGLRRKRGFGTCVQMFCAADHGTVIGYDDQAGRVIAELQVDHDDAVASWGLPVMRDAIDQFVDHLMLDPDVLDPCADVRNVSCDLVDLFWRHPTTREAAAWGAFPFEGAGATDEVPRPLAHAYTATYIRDAVRGGKFPDLGWRHWYEASLALSSSPVRVAVRAAERAYRRADGSDLAATSRLATVLRRASGRRWMTQPQTRRGSP